MSEETVDSHYTGCNKSIVSDPGRYLYNNIVVVICTVGTDEEQDFFFGGGDLRYPS
jgi:hypothetical protein